MPCRHPDDSLELYRECGGMDKEGLLMILCHSNSSKRSNPRILQDTSSQCWTLPDGGRNDSCLYRIHYLSAGIPDHMTDIRVLDPVLISNITNNCSRLGEDMAVSVQFFGEKSAVTWEVDGEPLPERYRLIDDNRTLIIPSVQRDDAERRFRVRITNPVSEEIREYRLKVRGYVFMEGIEASRFWYCCWRCPILF
ncbi:unnamed protein product [Staurois parvus]|uniref:Immunoglobulin I-set domain-containing protein n=1 Tax=Staurois parvus TaxID=386267 RepID=A0ABN9ATX3_9NEOB|nr:unnamed protein product [Staurois parvus]